MRSVRLVSVAARGSASVEIATREPIQNDESRVKSRFGSGSITKSGP